MSQYKFHEISDFERERFRLKLQEELESLHEIQNLLEGSLSQQEPSADFYQQRAKAIRLEGELKTKMKQIQVEKHLKMLTISLKDMKKLQANLKKRLVKKVDSKQAREKLSFLQHRLEEEILQEEFGLKSGFKSFPITSQELDFLLKNVAI